MDEQYLLQLNYIYALDLAISMIECLVEQQAMEDNWYVPGLLELKILRGDFPDDAT